MFLRKFIGNKNCGARGARVSSLMRHFHHPISPTHSLSLSLSLCTINFLTRSGSFASVNPDTFLILFSSLLTHDSPRSAACWTPLQLSSPLASQKALYGDSICPFLARHNTRSRRSSSIDCHFFNIQQRGSGIE